jgi:hypothetical protein
MTLEESVNDIFRKIGRNVMLFQNLEYLLKYLVATSSISGYESELKSQEEQRRSTINKQTMGQLVGQYIENSNPENQDILEDPKYIKEEMFLWVKYGFGDSTDYENSKKVLAKLVDDRNELIHHLLPQFDTNSIESCIQIGKKLDEQKSNIVREIDNLKRRIDAMHEGVKGIASFLNSPTGKKELEKIALLPRQRDLIWILSDIAEQTTRPNGWTPLNEAGQLIRQRVRQQVSEPEKIASIKEYFGYKSLKTFIIEAKIFDIYEEPTKKGIRILYRKKPNSELLNA